MLIKIIYLIIIIIMIYIVLVLFCYKNICSVFDREYLKNETVEQLRQLTMHIVCKKKIQFPISKYIYLNDKICGAYTNSTLLLAPSTSIYQIILDFDILKDNFYGFKVHRGALTAYEELKPQLMSIYPQTVAGYSIGAMISVLYAYDVWKQKGIKVALFLIGAPPIGNKKFKKEFDSIFRSVTYTNHKLDALAEPMMDQELFSYYHIGKNNKKYNFITDGLCRKFIPHIRYF